MDKQSSGGLFSRLTWAGKEIQLQTELIRSKGNRVVTLALADGAVVGRSDREWPSIREGQFLEQRRVSSYHERLLRAIKRLRDERDAKIDDLKRLFDRLASVALRLSRSPASEVLESLPLAQWITLAGSDGLAIDSSPKESPGTLWCPPAAGYRMVAEDLSKLFKGGEIQDIVVRLEKGYVIITPHKDNALVLGTEGLRLSELRKKTKDLLTGDRAF